jgi:hypothetical protein
MAKIYISSTYGDLIDYRIAVYDILRKVGHDAIAMEDYVASDERPAAKCLADVGSCHLYLGLIAWRYGYIPTQDNAENRSVTEMEFRQAGISKIARLMFLAHKDANIPDAFRDAKNGDNASGQRVKVFRAEVERDFLVSFFKSPDHLAGLVVAAVYRHFEGRARISSAPPASTAAALEARMLKTQQEALVRQIEAVNAEILVNIDPANLQKLQARLEQDLKKLTVIESRLQAEW